MDTGLQISALAAIKAVQSLVLAASVDNVSPMAVVAMASLGERIVVNPRLLPLAREALGAAKNVRMEKVKLSLGLSSGGFAAGVRSSSPALATFLLITALSSVMGSKDISEVLLEMIIESELIQETVIGPSEVLKLVETLLGNSNILLDQGHMPPEVFDPVQALATKDNAEFLFDVFDPMAAGRLLLSTFDAMQDNTVDNIRIMGREGGMTVVGVLRWLCPDKVEVVCEDGTTLAKSSKEPAKVTIVLCLKNMFRSWKKEVWHCLPEPSSIFDRAQAMSLPPSDITEITVTTDKDAQSPTQIPYPLAYTYWQTKDNAGLGIMKPIANLALGFVTAVLDSSMVESDHHTSAKDQSLRFIKICSPAFRSRYMGFPALLGFPKDSVDVPIVKSLGNYFARKEFVLVQYEKILAYVKVDAELRQIDEEVCGGALGTKGRSQSVLLATWKLATLIANLILLNATREMVGGSSMAYTFQEDRRRPWGDDLAVHNLLGEKRSIRGSEYLQSALLTAYGAGVRAPSHPLIAVSSHGRSCYLKSFTDSPRTPAEAFKIAVISGPMKWRNSPARFMYDSEVRSYPCYEPNPETIAVGAETEANPRDLTINTHAPFRYSLRAGEEDSSLCLSCIQQSDITDERSQFTQGLINWALATRMYPSNRSREDLASVLKQADITRIQLKHPARLAVYCARNQEIGAVATYNDREENQFLQLGTYDATCNNFVIQGPVSLLECTAQAYEKFGSSWIIMSNPY